MSGLFCPSNFPQKKEAQRVAVVAEEARRREVSRAVTAYVAGSEARRREEHGAGPLLEELVRAKKVRAAGLFCLG